MPTILALSKTYKIGKDDEYQEVTFTYDNDTYEGLTLSLIVNLGCIALVANAVCVPELMILSRGSKLINMYGVYNLTISLVGYEDAEFVIEVNPNDKYALEPAREKWGEVAVAQAIEPSVPCSLCGVAPCMCGQKISKQHD